MYSNLYLTRIQKLIERTKDINVRDKTINHVKNTEKNSCGFGLSKQFFRLDTKSINCEVKI